MADTGETSRDGGVNDHLLVGRNESGIRIAEEVIDEELARHGCTDLAAGR